MIENADDIEWDPEHRRRTRDELLRTVRSETQKRRKRLPWTIIIPSIFLLGSVTTGAIALLLPVTDKNVVHCLARAELHDDGSYPGIRVAVAAPNGDGIVPLDDALAACTQAWKDGLLDPADRDGATGGDGIPWTPPSRDGDVPELTACVMRDGTAGVVPGSRDVCLKLGLANHLDI